MVIAFAFFSYLLMDSLMNGMEEMSFENIKNYDTGNIQVAYPEYWEDREKLPLENLIYLNQDMEESIKNTDGILVPHNEWVGFWHPTRLRLFVFANRDSLIWSIILRQLTGWLKIHVVGFTDSNPRKPLKPLRQVPVTLTQ